MFKTFLRAVSVYLALILITAINSFSANVNFLNFENNVFTIKYTSSGEVLYDKMKLKKPNRLVVDLVGINKCSYCKSGSLLMRSGSITSKTNLHDKHDKVFDRYGESTLRIVFTFNNAMPTYRIKKGKNYLTVTFLNKNNHKASRVNSVAKHTKHKGVKAHKFSNKLERISYRKFKSYEMIVALLKSRPDYELTESKNAIYLTIKNAKANKAALESQDLSKISANIDKIETIKAENDSIEYAIYLKNPYSLKRDYKDKRHVYLIFGIDKKDSQIAVNKKASNDNVSDKKVAANAKQGNVLFKEDVKELKRKINKKKYTGKKISFDVRNADIKDVFRVFAQVSGLNFITSNDVSGTLTMKLDDVPWDQALDLIMQQKGLVYEKEGNIIRITTASKMRAEKKQELEAISEKQELERAKNAVTEVVNLNYITPDYAIKIVNGLLYKNKKSKSGFVVSDVKNNAVICHDTIDNIEKIKRIVSAIDKKKKVVEIDARIVEITKSFERQLGIQWGGSYENYYNAASKSHTFFGAGGSTAPSNPFNPNLPKDNFIVNLPATLSDAPVAGVLSLAVGRADYNVDLKLTAGEIEGYSKVLSSPKVITLDNEPAKIESGQEIPYQESAGASGATNVDFKDATLSLEVTPHVTNNNQVILKITVKKDSPDFGHAVNGEPPINTNKVDTTVVLSNGQTVVLGGLIQKTSLKSTGGVPVLMRVPFLGWLFKTKRVYNPESELFIFVTPKVISGK